MERAHFLREKTTLSGEGIVKLLLSGTWICFTAWQQDKRGLMELFFAPSTLMDFTTNDSDTFVVGFDIRLVPGGNTPSGVGYSVLSAISKLMMSLGTAMWMIAG